VVCSGVDRTLVGVLLSILILLAGAAVTVAATVAVAAATDAAADPAEAAPPPAQAATGPTATNRYSVIQDTLVVHGRSLTGDLLPATLGVTTVVDLERERGGADLGELLARIAGLQVRRYGGIGAQTLPSIRGSTAAQVQVLVDGLPLTDAQRGAVDISLLPLERFERAEIHRGLVPTKLGGIGAAGAVNLRSRQGIAGPEARLFTGSFGDLGGRLSFTVAGGDDSPSGFLLLHRRRIDNRYAYRDHNQTLHNPSDDMVRWRENADFTQWGVFGQGALPSGSGRLLTNAGYFRRDGGRPGPLGFPSPNARIQHERLNGRLGLLTLADALTADIVLSRQEDWLFDPQGEVGVDPYERTQAVSSAALGRLRWSLRWDPEPGYGFALTVGVDGHLQRYREINDGESHPLRLRNTLTTITGLSCELFDSRLLLHPTWRWQRFKDNFPPVPALPWLPEEESVTHQQDHVSPAFGASWRVVPGRLRIDFHWHDSVRQPTWVELFGQPGGMLGNRELVPEQILGRDLGLSWHLADGSAAVRLTGFEQTTTQTIIYSLAGFGTARPENIGRSRTRGLEWESFWQRGPLDLAFNLTWQKARDEGGVDATYAGKALPYLSDWEGFANLRWRLGDWRPGVSVIYQGVNYRTRYNREIDRVPARTLLNLSLAFSLDGGIWGRGHTATLTVEAHNLTDNDTYDVEGYPLPGRSARLALHWH
jgi:iron complex outermembrane receptor protein